MRHEVASEKLLELEYGELSPREAREVAAHAEGCAACRRELAAIRQTRAIMSGLGPEPAPERGEAILVAAAREAAASRRRRPLLPPWLWAGAAGAMAAAVVAVVSWQLARSPGAGPGGARTDELVGSAPSAVAPAGPGPGSPPAIAGAPDRAGGGVRASDGAPAGAVRDEGPSDAATSRVAPPAQEKAVGRVRALEEVRPAGGEARPERSPGGWEAPESAASEPRAPLPLRDTPAKREAPAERAEPATASGAWRSASAEAEEDAPRAAAPAPPARGAAEGAPAPLAATPSPAAAPPPRPARAPARGDEVASEARRLAKARAEERRAAAKAAAAEPPPIASVRVEVRTFRDCPGERRRLVEYAYDGTVHRYVREGDRRIVEHRYAPDGQLIAAFVTEAGVRRALPLDAPGLVRSAQDAGVDAPPRCRP